MRYHYDKDTVYIRGEFRAASTGIDGGLKHISTILTTPFRKTLTIPTLRDLSGNYLRAKDTEPTPSVC